MAKIRIGLGSDFALNNGRLGLGVSDPQVRLEVDGTTKSNDLVVTGVTSFTAYEGFLRADHQIDQDTILNVGQGLNASLSGEIIVKDGTTVTVGAVGLGTTSVGVGTEFITNTIDSNAVNLAGGSEIECLKVFNTFTPPSGGTNERPYAPKPGELYYNYDFKTIEFHDGYGWRQVDNTTRSGRGIFAGGFSNPLYHSIISYIQIPTTGNALNFGDLTTNAGFAPAVSNGKRAVWGSRYTGSGNNTMDYVTIPSQGNAIDFGNSTGSLWSRGGFSSSTRGIFFGGNPTSNVIEYIEIATIGDALDFGDIMSSRRDAAGLASATRGILSGGQPGIGADYTRIESITIASKGNSIRFGESTMGSMGMAGASNSTRGIFAGGTTVPTLDGNNTIEFVTISSEGNAVDFGDLTQKTYRFNAMSTGTRVVFAHGTTGPSGSVLLNTMDYINISSQGNATDFGDKIFAYGEYSGSGTSDSHGGLGGF